jgi:hypothetical protein
MEIFGTEKKSLKKIISNIFRTVTSNNITMSLIIGLLFNFLGVQIFPTINITLKFISAGAVPIALFGLGGVIVQYQLAQNMKKVGLISILSLLIHPLLTLTIGKVGFDLPVEALRSIIITAAMAPGINAFIFASIYKKETDVAAAAILVCTPLSIFATLVWITIL